jgi:hypothetical protein
MDGSYFKSRAAEHLPKEVHLDFGKYGYAAGPQDFESEDDSFIFETNEVSAFGKCNIYERHECLHVGSICPYCARKCDIRTSIRAR